jgi:hypothetical protein
MANQLDELCTRIDAYLRSEFDDDGDDGDELMEKLEAAIAGHPMCLL